MDMFKIRCSAISRIMAEPRSKADKEAGKLSKTTESYVKEWLTEKKFGLKKELLTKEVQKGHLVEDEAIQFLGEFDRAFYLKNEHHFSNEHITGTPDIITDSKIIDIKSSWDCFTFPLFDLQGDLNPAYYWQMQGYMALTGKDESEVVYCLMNTPEGLAYSVLDKVDYSEYASVDRIKKFRVERNDEDIAKIIIRVDQIRSYLSELNQKL